MLESRVPALWILDELKYVSQCDEAIQRSKGRLCVQHARTLLLAEGGVGICELPDTIWGVVRVDLPSPRKQNLCFQQVTSAKN
jgi:hypothetical protein